MTAGALPRDATLFAFVCHPQLDESSDGCAVLVFNRHMSIAAFHREAFITRGNLDGIIRTGTEHNVASIHQNKLQTCLIKVKFYLRFFPAYHAD
jgi:hypothetical protein